MENEFFSKPILNSPYACPARHWELEDKGQPTQQIVAERRRAEFITPIPKPKKHKGAVKQQQLFAFVERSGDKRQADNLTDQELLREVMNTVDKEGRLGESIRFRPFDKPKSGRMIAVKVPHHIGDGVMKAFTVN